jgi:lipid-A-disaccharide synthase-like uncharacterized protein
MSAAMSFRTKSILMNAAVVAALLYKLWRGAPVIVVVITAVVMFALVNGLMIFAAKRSNAGTNH